MEEKEGNSRARKQSWGSGRDRERCNMKEYTTNHALVHRWNTSYDKRSKSTLALDHHFLDDTVKWQGATRTGASTVRQYGDRGVGCV